MMMMLLLSLLVVVVIYTDSLKWNVLNMMVDKAPTKKPWELGR